MKIYGHPMSTCTRKVLTVLAETDTPHELVVVDFAKNEHKQEPHLSRQPFGQVPSLEDDGFQMYESRAMIRYINDKAKGQLIPSDLRERARMDQWISIESSNFTPSAMKFIFHHIFGYSQDPATLDEAGKKLDVALTVLEKRLGESQYLAGQSFTLADICYLPYVEYLMPTPVKDQIARYPNVSAWWKRCSERPSWKKAIGKA